MSFIDDVNAERAGVYFISYYTAADHFFNCFNERKYDLISNSVKRGDLMKPHPVLANILSLFCAYYFLIALMVKQIFA